MSRIDPHYTRPQVDALVEALADADTALDGRLDTAEEALDGRLSDVTLAATYATHFDITGKTSAQINAFLAAATPLKIKRLVGAVTLDDVVIFNTTDYRLDASGATLTCNGDQVWLKCIGGQSQSITNLKLVNTYTGTRTTYDIEWANPTHQGMFNVEVNLANGSLGKGGIRIYKDLGQPGSNYFMPRLSRVWVRNGHLIIDGVTDGKVSDSWVWAPFTGARAAVEVINSASNWTFTSVDVVPPQGNTSGYYLDTVENVQINGGMVDGSYDAILTGWGIKAVDCHRIASKTSFWNLGRGAIWLISTKASTFQGNLISRCNKTDNSWPDIQVDDSRYNNFIGNTHSALSDRTNKGLIYVETGTSTDNVIDGNTMESNEGAHYYHSTLVTVLANSRLGLNNRPLSAWPRSLARTVTASEIIPQENVNRGYTLFGSGTITMTLPSAGAFFLGSSLPIKNIGSGTITIAANAAETIDGAASTSLGPGQSATFTTSGATAWRVISGKGVAFDTIVPPASLISIPAAATWPAANAAIFHKFTVVDGGVYRYQNFRLDVSSGNFHCAVVRLSGAALGSYEVVATNGVVATPSAGDLTVDLGATHLPAGQYALALWFDNNTVQVRQGGNTGMTASRLSAYVTGLTGGIPSSGSLSWGSTQYIGGMTLGATV